MISAPEVLARAIHRDAAAKAIHVIVTNLVPTVVSNSATEHPLPVSDKDTAFDLVQVMDFRDTAQYQTRTDTCGQDAYELY